LSEEPAECAARARQAQRRPRRARRHLLRLAEWANDNVSRAGTNSGRRPFRREGELLLRYRKTGSCLCRAQPGSEPQPAAALLSPSREHPRRASTLAELWPVAQRGEFRNGYVAPGSTEPRRANDRAKVDLAILVAITRAKVEAACSHAQKERGTRYRADGSRALLSWSAHTPLPLCALAPLLPFRTPRKARRSMLIVGRPGVQSRRERSGPNGYLCDSPKHAGPTLSVLACTPGGLTKLTSLGCR
jgi:hypothetical protein